MAKRKILIQLDTDAHPSVFDRVVAVDAGAEEIFSYGGVKPEAVAPLVHGAIFTRSPKDLASTAIFIGGSEVAAGEALLKEAVRHMLPQFGLRVSVLLDANGANTTAAAAVRAAGRHLALKEARALVLGGTGPVGSAWLCCWRAKEPRCVWLRANSLVPARRPTRSGAALPPRRYSRSPSPVLTI